MKNRLLFTIIFLIIFGNLLSQNSADTIIKISEVDIFHQKIFAQESAGMKKSSVDTIVLLEKTNLSLSDVLSQNTSVFIKNYGRGALATAAFRGTAASHTQVNWNGVNINSPMTGMVDFSLIPVFFIDDLELNHGSASISENSGGIGGSVNICNSINWNDKLKIEYTQAVGSFSTFNEFLKFSVGNKKFQSKTRVFHNYSKNNFKFINRGIVDIDSVTGKKTNPIDTNDNADYKIFGVLQEFYFKPNSQNVFSLKWWGQNSDRTIPRTTSYEGPDNSNRNNLTDLDNKIVADYKKILPTGKFYFSSGFAQKNITYILLNQVVGYGSVPAVFSESKQYSSVNKAKFVFEFNKNFQLKTSVDANFHWVETADTVAKTGYKKHRNEFSYFLNLSKSFANKLNVNFMLRQDFIDNKFCPTVPFIGFDYKLIKKYNFFLKGNFSGNYHQASLNELFWQPGGNPNLKPESGYSGELGTKFQLIFENLKFGTELTGYYSKINNWIIWLPSFKGYWEPKNIRQVLAKGLEFEIKISGKIKKIRYNFIGNYAYTSSKNYGDTLVWGSKSYGKQLVYVPLHSGNLMFYVAYKKFHITYQHNSYSERFTTSSNQTTKRDWLYPYFMNDLIVGKTFMLPKVKISAEFIIYNLFNETYHTVLYRPMPKRNFLFSLTFTLLN